MSRATFVVSRVACDKSHRRGEDCAYRVTWAINPHMRIGEVELKRALREHHAFCETLRREGAELIALPFVHGAFDSVFSKDNAVLLADGRGRRALMTTPLHGQRTQEQATRAQTFAAAGFAVHAQPKHALEGGDVAVLPSGAALMGHGPRSSWRAAGALEDFLGAEVTPLELVDPFFFHLDVALSFLSDGTVLLHPEAFTRTALKAIERHDAVKRLVPIPRDEALGFGLNMVEVARSVVLGGPAPTVERALALAGWKPVIAPLPQFHLSGGSAGCLAARVSVTSKLAASAEGHCSLAASSARSLAC